MSLRLLPIAALSLVLGCTVGARDPAMVDAGLELDAGSVADVGGLPGADAGPVGADAASPGRDAAAPGPDAASIDAGSVEGIIATMPENSWRRLTDTRLASVCPKTLNHYQCDAVTGAWSGAAYDPESDRLVVFGGGHNDGFLNNVFGFDVRARAWTRWTELPAPLDGLPDSNAAIPAVYQDKRIETCGLYPKGSTLTIDAAWLTPTGYLPYAKCDDPAIVPQLDDQQPRSAHTYGNLAVTGGRFLILGAAGLYPSGQAGSPRVMAFDFGTRRWERRAENPIAGYGTSAVDAKGHVFYAGNSALQEYDPVANTWTAVPNGGSADGYYAAAAVDTVRNRLVLTRNGATVHTWALGAGYAHEARATGLSPALPEALGFDYATHLDKFIAWPGGTEVAVLDAASLMWTRVTTGGDDPGPRTQNGTFGRFRYAPKLKVFVLVNDANQDVLLYKP